MDKNWLSRAEPIYTNEGLKKLKNSKVAILGLGGVGSAVAEGICRSGIGNIMIVDNDTIDITNINRQLIANTQNIGKLKTDETKKKLLLINPNCNIMAVNTFYLPENSDFLFEYAPDYIIDAIDTVTAKLHLAQISFEKNIPLISCLGTGNRLDPSQLCYGDISNTAGTGCPFARIMRKEIKKREISKLDVVYSKELPFKATMEDSEHGRHSPASCAFVPPAAGFLIASIVVRKILKII